MVNTMLNTLSHVNNIQSLEYNSKALNARLQTNTLQALSILPCSFVEHDGRRVHINIFFYFFIFFIKLTIYLS